ATLPPPRAAPSTPPRPPPAARRPPASSARRSRNLGPRTSARDHRTPLSPFTSQSSLLTRELLWPRFFRLLHYPFSRLTGWEQDGMEYAPPVLACFSTGVKQFPSVFSYAGRMKRVVYDQALVAYLDI